MLIKIILLAAVLLAAIFLIKGTQQTKNVALRRLLLLVFVILAIITILFPDLTTKVANFVGVGRGVDLLLYLLIIAFLSYSVVSYRRMNILENRLVDLSRELAIARTHPNTITRTGEFTASPNPSDAVLHGQAPDLATDQLPEPADHPLEEQAQCKQPGADNSQ